MSDAAYGIAADCCKKYLAATDGTAEDGIHRIGTERFEQMVTDVEAALERYDPKEGSA